jgi:hypothetical protein
MVRFPALLLVVALISPALLSAADAGTAEGKLTIEDKTFKLTHAYAITRLTEDHETYYKIIFSDAALTDQDLKLFPDAEMARINAGKLHMLKVDLDNKRAPYDAEFYWASNISTFSDPNPTKLTLKSSDGKTIAGRVYLDKPITDMGGTYMFDVKFSAPLRSESDLTP